MVKGAVAKGSAWLQHLRNERLQSLPNPFGRSITRIAAAAAVIILILFVTARNVSVPNALRKVVPKPTPRPRVAPQTKCAPERAPEMEWKNFLGLNESEWKFLPERDGDNYGLSRAQCRAAFPKLFVEIENVVKARKGKRITFDEVETRAGEFGTARLMIHSGDLYIINMEDMKYTQTRSMATLNALHRALISYPDRYHLPNIEFIFTAHDYAQRDDLSWVYTKRPNDTHCWMMPDFGQWSWPETNVGSYRDVRRRIKEVEESFEIVDGKPQPNLAFSNKEKKVFWRGNLKTGTDIRQKLFDATKDKDWAAVETLDWDDKKEVAERYVTLEDHCQYMFLVHVEGRSYSGRGKYLQNCRSVIIAHELQWLEPHHGALVSEGPDANFVQVHRNFSNLEEKVTHLLENPEEAERIADNSVRDFRDRYLTPAAEACYWRELIRAYGAMSDFEPVSQIWDPQMQQTVYRGVPFEAFILKPESAQPA